MTAFGLKDKDKVSVILLASMFMNVKNKWLPVQNTYRRPIKTPRFRPAP
jgi:hypothetical protein